jgi:hypothetical protein
VIQVAILTKPGDVVCRSCRVAASYHASTHGKRDVFIHRQGLCMYLQEPH